jgi:alpha-ketoglutarate-dependent taurine dioxygenase
MDNPFAGYYLKIVERTPQEISARLTADGIVTFDGVRSRGHFATITATLLRPWRHRDAGPDHVTAIEPRTQMAALPGCVGFSLAELCPHTEASATAEPPGLVALSCEQPAPAGGVSFLVDAAAVYRELADLRPTALAALSADDAAVFGGDAGFRGPVFDRRVDGRVQVRLRLDNLASFDVSEAALAELRSAISRHTRWLPLTAGQAFVIDNRRILHGRTAFSGQRRVYRMLGDPLPQLAFRPGFEHAPITQNLR